MSRSLADIDVTQLSEEARWTLENISRPHAEGVPEKELADLLGLELADLQRRVDELAAEWTALSGGPTVPPMTEDEFEALVDSIAEHGQLVPIYTDARGLAGIIDGRNRRRACARLGIEPRHEPIVERVLEDDELQRLALVVNVARRQLPAGARRGFVAAELKRDATRSDRAIAVLCGVSQPLVGRVRRQLEETGQVKRVITRTGIDGKQQRVGDRPAPPPRLGLSERGVSAAASTADGVNVFIGAELATELAQGWSPAVQIRLEPVAGGYTLRVRRAVSI